MFIKEQLFRNSAFRIYLRDLAQFRPVMKCVACVHPSPPLKTKSPFFYLLVGGGTDVHRLEI